MIRQPDYLGLVTLLPILRHLVDAAGVVTLEPEEADRIRALGFHAQAGRWSVPRLPADLVAGNPLLEPLGDDVDHFWKPSSPASAESLQVRVTDTQSAETHDVVDTISPDAPRGTSSSTAPISPEPKTIPELVPDYTLEKECAAIFEAVERAGGRIPKRLLQKKLWRIRAERFNQVIQSLVEQKSIRVEGNMLMASQKNENATAITGDGGI